MKKSLWLLYSVGCLALLVVAVTLWRGPLSSQPVANEAVLAPAGPAASVASSVPVMTSPVASAVPAVLAPESSSSPRSVAAVAFNAWAEKFASASPAARPALLAEGENLARERYRQMAQLIKEDPQQALTLALPYRLRQAMPVTLAPYLEQPVSGRGEFKVIQSWAAEEQSNQPPVEYRVTLNKTIYEAFTFGSRANQRSRRHISLHGVALTDEGGRKMMALSGDMLRVLQAEEAKDLAAVGKLPAVAQCPVCSATVADPAVATVAEMGGEYLVFDQAAHAAAYGAQLNQAAAKYWPSATVTTAARSAVKAAADQTGEALFPQLDPPAHGDVKGNLKLLYMPVLFADDPIPPESQDAAQATCANVARVYKENSYGSVNWETDVTPLLRLPHRKTAYADGIAGGTPVSVLGDAQAIARTLGYFGPYDDQYVVFNSLNPVVTFGGRSDGLINGSPGAMPHEVGHSTFGWTHANYLDLSGTIGMPTDGRPVDPDSSIGHDDVNAPLPFPVGKPQMVVYGDPFDIMGGGGSHFSTFFKNQVNWLTDDRVRFINSNQTNRIFAFDVPYVFPERLYALRMHKDYDKEYWISYRQAFGSNPWLSHGVELQWYATSAGNNTLLLDSTSTSYNRKNDCAITIGRTFSDPPAHLFVTPVAQGGESPTNKWIDVVVNVGPFPNNNPPVISLAADDLSVGLNQVVTLTATVQDPDGDTVAYNWDFGDLSFGPNQAVVTNSWPTAGQYVVRCEVSDMKGGVASAYVVVVVGNPATYTISGRVLDQDGNPVQGVRVHNGTALPANPALPAEGADPNPAPVNPTTHRATYTDSHGYYTIGNVPPGEYKCRAFIYGYNTVAQFVDPVDINTASANGLNFVATRLTHVTVEKIVDAPENGVPAEGVTNSGIFRITRDGGDWSQPLPVRYRLDGTAVMPVDYLLWQENLWTNVITLPNGTKVTNVAQNAIGRTEIPAWQPYVDMAVTGIDNANGNGNQSVIMTLLLQTNDFRVTEFLTNVIYTNYIATNAFYLVTNTELHFRTNMVPIPGWELLPYGPAGTLTWFQINPTYVIDNAEATVWLLDDDTPNLPTVSVQAIGAVASETYNDHGMFMFTRNDAPLTNDLTIYFTTSGDAVPNEDYAALPSQVTIRAGESFALVPVVAINDLFVEGPETVTVSITPDAAYDGFGAASVTILDDDLPDVIIYASDSVAGKTGGNNGRVTVSRNGDLNQPLVVNYLVSGTAVSGRDFQPLSQQVTIPAGSSTADIVIIPINNTNVGARTVVIQVADSQAYTIDFQNTATVTIQDALPTVTMTVAGTPAEAGGVASFTVQRDGPTTNSLTVFFSIGGSAVEISDYSAIGTNVVIPIGSASAVVQIAPMNDLYRELGEKFGQETVILRLQPGPDYNIGAPDSGTVRITDNEGDPSWPEIGFMTTGTTVREDAGMVYVLVKCSANPTTALPINFEFHQAGGNAAENVNYRAGLWCATNTPLVWIAPAGGFVTNLVPMYNLGRFRHFTPPSPAGEFTSPEDTIGYIPITIMNDNAAAGNKTLTVRLFPPTGYDTNFVVVTNIITVTNGGTTSYVTNTSTNTFIAHMATNAYLGDYLTHTITIVDVGVTTVGVTVPEPVAFESGQRPGRFVITRQGPTTAPLTVSYAITGTAAPGNDYVPLTTNGRVATVTIPAGTNQVAIQVVPIDNPTEQYPDRTVVLTIVNAPGYSSASSGTVTIISDDGTVQFTSAKYQFLENSGTVTIPVVRSNDTNRQTTVDYQFIDFSATNGVDYYGTNARVTFEPGEVRKDILFAIQDDNIVELDKIFKIRLLNPTGGVPLGGQNEATVVILDDDSAIGFATNTFAVNENGTNAFIVLQRRGILTNTASVTFSTVDGTATNLLDYSNVTVSVTFDPGVALVTNLVPVINDNLFEGDETVGLVLSDPVGLHVALDTIALATLVILDDECTFTFTTNNFVVWEYAPYAEVTVQRVGGAVNPVDVSFISFDGTASNRVDYLLTNATLHFNGNEWLIATNGTGFAEYHPGDTTQTVLVPLLDDTLGEGNEFFNVSLTTVANLAPQPLPGDTLLGPVSNAIVTILDNEMPGNVDYEYMQPTVGNPTPGPNGPVYGLALQHNGQCVLGGEFTRVDDVVYTRIARLQSNGVVDPYFNPGFGANGTIYSVAVGADDKIVAGGAFTRMGVSNWAGIARLRANGDVDPSFNPGIGVSNGVVRAVAVQTDGSILLGGDFILVDGLLRARIARLATNGLLDGAFRPSVDAPVYALAIQPDGMILVGGGFTNINGVIRRSIARLTVDGAVDTSFIGFTNLLGPVYSIAVQADHRIVVGGAFTNADGLTNGNALVRLLADGSVDPTFNTGEGLREQRAAVNAVALDGRGRILIGGSFTNYNGVSRNFFARVAQSGALDSSFDVGSGANAIVRTLVVQPDTAVIIGGDFTVVNEIPRAHLARIHGNEKWNIPGVEFTASVFYVVETNGPAVITVQRTGNTNVAFAVDFATSDGTATNGVDYLGTTTNLSFAVGEMTKTIYIPVIPHPAITGNKTVNLTLLNAPANVDLSGQSTAVLVIVDAEKSVRFSEPDYVVAANVTNAVIEVFREGNLEDQISVTLRTMPGGTAVPGVDYGPVSNILTFAAGQTNQIVLVPVYYHPSEGLVKTVLLVLTNPVGCGYDYPSNAWLYIRDVTLGLGSVEPAFDPGTGAGGGRLVRALALAPDGKILVGGAFSSFNGVSRHDVARLEADGMLDLDFDPGVGPNSMVFAVAALANGKTVIGGSFTSVSGALHNYVARLLTNGAVDTTFSQSSQLDGGLTSLAVQDSGKVVVGGGFTHPSSFLARIRSDGSADNKFEVGTGADSIIHAVCVITNGTNVQLLVGGAFTVFNDLPRSLVARLSSDGNVDTDFTPPGGP